MTYKDYVRILFSIVLLAMMWMGNKYALYLIITISTIGCELVSLMLKDLIKFVKEGYKNDPR